MHDSARCEATIVAGRESEFVGTCVMAEVSGRIHFFTRDDREAQLVEFEIHCKRLADLLRRHGDLYVADLVQARAHAAGRLLAADYTQDDLNDLAATFPTPDWMNSKAVDFDAPRTALQDEAARLHRLALTVAADLRALATTYGSLT